MMVGLFVFQIRKEIKMRRLVSVVSVVTLLMVMLCGCQEKEYIGLEKQFDFEVSENSADKILEYYGASLSLDFPDPAIIDAEQEWQIDNLKVKLDEVNVQFPSILGQMFIETEKFYKKADFTVNYMYGLDFQLEGGKYVYVDVNYDANSSYELTIENETNETMSASDAFVTNLDVLEWKDASIPGFVFYNNVTTFDEVVDTLGTPYAVYLKKMLLSQKQTLYLYYKFMNGYVSFSFDGFDSGENDKVTGFGLVAGT